MAEKVGTIYYDLDLDDSKYTAKAQKAGNDADDFGKRLENATGQLVALGAIAAIALTQVVTYLDKAVDASVRQQNALMGLSSVAKGTGNSIDAATQAAKDLTADGLMPIGDAATGLKNLLASGFSLPQAIKLMNAFKDSAAFGRQGSLEFGQAISSATEGIKNGNSVLVDNAGVTKNLSNILVDAGFSAQDLSKASQDAGVRMALFNGIIGETKNQTGDAAKLADSFGGSLARQTTATTNLNVALGTALQPILSKIMDIIAPIIQAITDWTKKNPALAAAIAVAAVVSLALAAGIGLIAAAIGAVMTIGAPMVGIVALIAVGIGALIGTLLYLENQFGFVTDAISKSKEAIDKAINIIDDLYKKISNFLNPILKDMAKFVDEAKDAILKLKDDAIKKIQDVVKGANDKFSELNKWLEKNKDTIYIIIGIITTLFLPALVRLGVQALIAGTELAIGALIGAAAWIAGAISASVAWVIQLGKIIVQSSITAIKTAIQAVISGAAWVKQAIVASAAWVAQFLLMIAKAAITAIAFAAQAAIAGYAWIFQAISVSAIWLFTVFPQMVAGAVSTAISFVAQAAIAVAGWLSNAPAMLIAWGISFAGMVAGAISTAITFVIQSAISIAGWIAGAVTTAISWAISFAGMIAGAIATGAAMLIAGAQAAIAWLMALGPIGLIIAAIAAVIAIVWAVIANWKTIGPFFADLFKNIGKGVVDLVNTFLKVGGDMINGLIKGISGGANAVVDKIKEICSGALDAVKNFFGIKSPSRVMASMGDYMMQGMQNGIERAGGAVVDAATTIADKISTGMSNSLQNVSDGAQSVVGVYSGMYGQLNAMNAVQAGTINGTVSAINGAAAATATTGGAIAQPPINITLEQTGIVARSRSEFRDIIADGIEAVNEDLRARGYGEIGNGNVKGMSTI